MKYTLKKSILGKGAPGNKKQTSIPGKAASSYRDIFEAVNDGILIHDIQDGRILDANRCVLEMYGYTIEEIVHKDVTSLSEGVAPYSRQEVRKLIDKTLKGEHSLFEWKARKKNGDLFWAEVNLKSAVLDGEKRIIATIRDITERKQFEKDLKSQTGRLKHIMDANQRSDRKYKTILETAVDGFWLADLKGKLLDVNEAYCRMSGYSEAELLSMHIPELEGNMDADEVASKIDGVLRHGQDRFETRHRHKDGSLYDVEVSVQYLKDVDDKMVIFLRNITGQKKAEKEKEHLHAQLIQAQKMESVGRLAGGVAHDFNNLMGVIFGHAELAMDQIDTDHDVHASLQQILSAAQRASDVTRQLLAFARKQTIAPKILDMNNTVEGILKIVIRLIGEDIELAWLPGKNLWPVKMDPTQIDQILVNLCVNARDAIDGVGNISIETAMVSFDEEYCDDNPGFAPGDYVSLSVSDDGCGIGKDTLQNIFEPFFTTKSLDKGTGLGLSTVYGIVKQNKGFIKVYSEPDIGTTFKVFFPRHSNARLTPLEKNKIRQYKGGSETVLLVEDEPAILNITKKMLTRLGYNVLEAPLPTPAVEMARSYKDKIHLLVTDVIMPEMNGLELVERLRSIHPGLKHLFMSGYTANVIGHHGILNEGVNFIQKPFSKNDLDQKIRELLD
jgi:PAS domain S-box-containing protein